ncbi:hypothetical protein [Desulfopila sp. IMCC35008]|uniref:hypothetical protein n=1 Tax=Desulfopila sp. IMCC35008 TaxID=2653858 RepID=UPI0013D00D90|nr:hypothetical protein [Desulfopila sp. IMCC35008]
MAQWRIKYRNEFPEVFKMLQNDFGDASQGSAFIALKEAYLKNVKERNSEFVKRAIQFVDWVLVSGRDDMVAKCNACFVEHALEKLNEEDLDFVKPFFTSKLKKQLLNFGFPENKIQ